MKARKRKDERHRDSSDAKRRKLEQRRGKGPLVPPRESNALLPPYKDFLGAGGRNTSSDDQQQRQIPTPGFRLIGDDEENTRCGDESESEDEEIERNKCSSREEERSHEEEPEEPDRSSRFRSSGKAIYKGLLDRNRGCNCNVLVVEFDRGWREYGATVELHSNHRGWYLCVLLQGETLFVQEIRRRFFHYSTNGFTGSYMWKADKGWMLEFKNTMQLNAFKKVFEKCYQKNYTLAASRKVPAPKFQLAKNLDTRWRGPAFIRPATGYIPEPELDLETRVLYDMDSEDEEWLQNISGKVGTYKQKISEPKFEKVIYTLEKYSHDRHEILSEDAACEVCLHAASLKIIKLIHGYWIEKRRRKGMSLVRHFQPERWKQYRDASKKEKKHLFAFCMRPRGLEIPPEIPQSVSSNSPVSEAPAQQTPNSNGVENIDSPSLPEVCDGAVTPSDEKEAESRGPAQPLGWKKFVGREKTVRPIQQAQPPAQGALVWKKYTGRANPEEMKKLKLMHKLRQSGIKQFARRAKVPMMKSKSSKSSKSSSLTNEAELSQEGASDLLALAEAAVLNNTSPCSKPRRVREESETESEIETPAKEVENSPADEMIRERAQLEKQLLRQQMNQLKQQMKMVNQQHQHQQQQPLESSIPELQDFGTWSLEFQKTMDRLEKKKEQQLRRVRNKDQKRVVSLSVKSASSRFRTLLLVVANSAQIESSS